MHVVRRVSVGGAGVDVRPRLSRLENARYPVVWELLERRIMWSASASSSTLASLAGEAAFGSFANNGTVRVEGTLVEGTRSIALQPDGKMVVAAWSNPKTPAGKVGIDQATSVTLIRLNRGGTLDTSFGDGGFVRFDVGSRYWYYDALPIVLQGDGKILVGGESLRRFNSDGSIDTTFGTNGVVRTDLFGGDLVRTIAVTSEGKILTAGWNFDVQRFNTDGSRDTTFATADQAWASHSYPHGTITRIFIQPDGKILMAGQEVTGGGIGQPLITVQMLVRLNADGTVDTAYGDNGVVHQSARSGNQLDGTAAAMQPDGKVLLGGYDDHGTAIVRYDTDGTIDESFGDDGFYTNNDGSSPNDIGVDADGKIVIVGSYGLPAMWRLNSDGSEDNTFARVTRPLDSDLNFIGYASAVTVEPDGDVLMTTLGVGEFWANREKAERLGDFYVTRISGGHSDAEPPDQPTNPPPPPPPPPPAPEPPEPAPESGSQNPRGALDDSFGNDGIVRTDATGGVERAQEVLVQADGKVVVVGYSGTYPAEGAEAIGDPNGNIETNVTLVRYKVDGSLDSSFGDHGVVTAPARNLVGGRYDGADLHAALQADGKIVVGGMALYRFNADGSVDTAFGDNGAAATGLLLVDALAVLPNGKIIISTRYGYTFAMYNSDGTLDTTFGGAARSTADNGLPVTPGSVSHEPSLALAAWSEIGELIAQPDGKVIAVGTVRVLPNDTYATRQYLIRMNADGSLDATFGDGGVVITKFPGFPAAEAWAVALQSNGKIVVSGIGGTIARYNTDGSLDTGFGHGGLLRTTRDGAGRDVAVQADGKVVVTTDSGAVRYNADGSVDRTFIAPGNPGTRAVAIAPDGAIVIVGQPEQLGRAAASDFFVARFSPNALEVDHNASGGFGGNDSLFAQRDRIRLLDDPDAGNDDGLLDFGDKDDEEFLTLPEIL